MIKIGMEKEALFFDENYEPVNFNKDSLRKNITLDFASNQIEIISKPHSHVSHLIKEMNELQNDELLSKHITWPLSQIGFNDYEMKFDGLEKKEEIEYRKKLSEKYPIELMNFSGIHLNVNFEEEKNEQKYFELLQKLYVYGPLILQFFSFTPLYQNGILDEGLEEIGKNKGLENSLSLRNTQKWGYTNEHKIPINYENLEQYKESLDEAIKEEKIDSLKEYYSKIRFKKNENGDPYLEIRFIDLNPYYRLGITYEQLKLLDVFIRFLHDKENYEFDYKECLENFEKVSTQGNNKNLKLKISGREKTLEEHTKNLLDKISRSNFLNLAEKKIIENFKKNYLNNALDIDKMLKEINFEKLTILEFGKKHAKKKEKFEELYSEENLELSTKILKKKATELDYKVNVIDEYENFLEIQDINGNKEYVIQATKTNMDKYVNILIMENKFMTKFVFRKNNLKIAKDQLIHKNELKNINVIFKDWKNKKIVVKPIDTNFGLGITILNSNFTQEELKNSFEFAFLYAERLLIEEFFEGVEYRFLVIDEKVQSIVQRIPANVVGDGILTIEQLVEEKNQNSLRGKGYKTPVEKIVIGDIEKEYLRKNNMTSETVVETGKRIFLRENSNVSTGGDSVEVSEIIPEQFKEIAIETTSALNVAICGIDMIINDDFTDYIIVEANFNPAIQMHTYPVYGIGKNPAKAILKLLFKGN